MSRRSGTQYVGFTGFGTAGSENDPLDVWTPGYHGYQAWNYDPGMAGAAGGASGTTTCWAIRVFCPRGFTLTKLGYFVSTANGTPTADATTTNTNSTDVTTLTGAQSLTVGANTFAASGTFTAPTTSPVGTVVISYGGGGGTTTLTSCQTRYGSTGTMGAAVTITQSLNDFGVFDNTGATLLGYLASQGANWGGTGQNGTAAANQTLTTMNGVSAAITAGTYLWVVYLATGTTSPSFRAVNNSSLAPNVGIASVANLRIGRVSAAQTSFPATITPGSLVSTNTASPGYPWVGVL